MNQSSGTISISILNKRKQGIFIFLLLSGYCLLFSPATLFAQADTTLVDSAITSVTFDNSRARVEFFKGSNIGNFNKLDTTIDDFQKFNPARNQIFDHAYLGNLGSPYYPRWFEFERKLGFDYGRHERDLYLFDIDELKYFRNNVPYTDLYYVTGSNAEQLFHVTHARNIGKDINISLDFEKIASEGYYQHMRNDYTNVALTGWYKTPKGKYSVYAAGIRSLNKNDENGGINNDTIFDYPNPDLAAPFRNEAFTEWNNWQGQIMQQYQLGKSITYAVNDSTNATYFAPAVALTHTFGLHNYYYLFEDAELDQSFYGYIFVNADTLRDEADVDGFYNRFSVGNVKYKTVAKDSTVQTRFNWEAFALQQYHELSDQSGEIKYNNYIAGVNIAGRYLFDSLLNFKINGEYDLVKNDYEASASIKFPTLNFHPVISLLNARYSPTAMQTHYYGFNNRWDIDHGQIRYSQIDLSISNKEFGTRLHFSYERSKNFILTSFNLLGGYYPQHIDIAIGKILLRQNFKLGNFHLNNTIGLQHSMDAEIDLPKILANISWYYQNHLFKSALFFQTGINVWYNSDYDLQGYDFVNGNWIYYASFDDPTIQNFQPVVDVFANFDIQTFRFFIKMDNVAQGLFNKGYFEAPYYPMQPRGFKLGIDWFLFY